MRYGSVNVVLGPCVDVPFSELGALDDVDDFSGSSAEEVGGGGGSMTAGSGFEIGSGRAGIGSSAEEVSIVICFVIGGDCLNV